MNQEEDFVNIGEPFSKHVSKAEDILRFVRKDLDDIRWSNDKTEFDDLLAVKKDSHPGPDGIPCGAYRCVGGLGSQFLCNAYRAPLEGGNVPDHLPESRIFLNTETSDMDDNGWIVRSPDALRPLTLQLRLQTSYFRHLSRHSLVHHEVHSSISSGQMTDNIFEIETTALAHVTCSPQESGVLLTDFACPGSFL